jgi:hypothetical protein
MKLIKYFITLAFAGLMISCSATMPPQELVDARLAYQLASTGPAAQLVPAELHKAQIAIELAEKSFLEDPDSYMTRDLSYVADRKSKLAGALAVTFAENAATEKAKKDYEVTQTEIMKNTTETSLRSKHGLMPS